MNKVIKSILFGIAFFPLTGCLSNLDLHPIDSDTPNTFFKDSAACAKVLVGCYDALSVPGGGLFDGSMNSQFVIWNVTDEMYNAAAGTGPKVYSYTSGYAPNATMYKNLYAAIQRCCQFLHYLPDAKMTTETKLAMEGEVQFIRAFCYFNLVQNYGRVPLVTEASSDVNSTSAKQAEEADIYDFVIREMEEAESKVFPITKFNFGGRINKSAVRGVLARVCLFNAGFPCYNTERYKDAYKWAKMVIDDPAHSLIPNFAEAFIPLIQDKYDIRENLWEIEAYCKSTSDGLKEYFPSLSTSLGTNCSKAVANVSFMVNNTMKITKRMFSYYEQDTEALLGSYDERRNWAIAPFTNAPTKLDGADRLVLTYFGSHKDPDNDRLVYDRQVNKFNRQYAKIWPAYQSNTGTNLCIVRYSDVLLMAAEALCQINNGSTPEAIGYVNAVRKRAYGQMDGRKFIDHIELTNPGENYTIDEVCVEIVDVTDNTASVTCTTEENKSPKAYRVGDVKGPLTIATAKLLEILGSDGKPDTKATRPIESIVLLDRGHAYSETPKVVIRSLEGGKGPKGSGATAIAVMKDESPSYELPAEATDSKEAFLQTIMDERARELCFEGWRRLDLKRWHNLVEVLQATRDDGRNAKGVNGAQLDYIMTPGNNVSDVHYYLPIPSGEIMLNPELKQNEGW